MDLNKLLKYRKYPIIDRLIVRKFSRYGVFLPRDAVLGTNVQFRHNAPGTVIHPHCVIGNNVKIYQNVTLGRGDLYNTLASSKFLGIHIKDYVILGAGAKILCSDGTLTIGENSVIAANAVVLDSVPANEVWGGIPAKRISSIKK